MLNDCKSHNHYRFLENLLKKYKLEFDETCTHIRKHLGNILQSISNDMKTKMRSLDLSSFCVAAR